MMRLLLPFVLPVIFSSCTGSKSLKNWIGDSQQNLILKMGPPVKTTSDGGNGEIMIYANQIGSGINPIFDYKMFYIDSVGNIYHSRKDKRNLPPSEIERF